MLSYTQLVKGFFAAVPVAVILAGASFAQVSVSPMKIEVQAHRAQGQGVINITNTSNKTFRARVYAEAFTYSRGEGFKILPSSPSDLRPYLQFSPRELVVEPGTTRRIRLNARLAPSLPNGEYRAIIFTEPLQQNVVTDGNGNSTRIITRIGTAFFVRKGGVSPNLKVESARWNNDNQQMQLLVSNSGNSSAYTTVRWTLKQGNKIIKTGESQAAGIVPESERYLILNQSKKDMLNLAAGKYELSGELLWGENNQNKQRFNVELNSQ